MSLDLKSELSLDRALLLDVPPGHQRRSCLKNYLHITSAAEARVAFSTSLGTSSRSPQPIFALLFAIFGKFCVCCVICFALFCYFRSALEGAMCGASVRALFLDSNPTWGPALQHP